MNLTQRIMVYRLDEGQIELIGKNLPASNYEIFETDEVTDLIALNSVSCIINADALSQDDRELLWSFYREINCCTDETILWGFCADRHMV